MLSRLTEICLCLSLFLFSIQLHAHAKLDSVRLVNGNEITGEIKRLLRGILSYGTDSMGTVAIEWDDVIAVTSNFNYEVRLENGMRYYGSLIGEEWGEPFVTAGPLAIPRVESLLP